MKLTSPLFQEGGIIPSCCTCEGEESHPPLEFHHVPKEAKSLVLIMEDPDVPAFVRPDQMWDHWVVFNIPPTAKGISTQGPVPGVQGKNTGGSIGYQGPCPPDREHRYFFKLYALDTMLDLPSGVTKKQVEQAIKHHILAETHLMGRYEKGKGY